MKFGIVDFWFGRPAEVAVVNTGYDTDDGGEGIRPAAGDVFADWVIVWEITPGEFFVDDGNWRGTGAILLGESATAQ